MDKKIIFLELISDLKEYLKNVYKNKTYLEFDYQEYILNVGINMFGITKPILSVVLLENLNIDIAFNIYPENVEELEDSQTMYVAGKSQIIIESCKDKCNVKIARDLFNPYSIYDEYDDLTIQEVKDIVFPKIKERIDIIKNRYIKKISQKA